MRSKAGKTDDQGNQLPTFVLTILAGVNVFFLNLKVEGNLCANVFVYLCGNA